jgi:hypothetical protein
MAVGVVSLLQEQPACFVGSTGSGSRSLARSLTLQTDGQTDRRRLSRRLTPAGDGRLQYI